MSAPPTLSPPRPEVPADEPARFSLSVTQVLASALAAITATVAASYLGVAGTVIGAAVASVLTVVGNAVYGHSIRRTSDRVREAVPLAARFPRAGEPMAPLRRSPARQRGAWPVVAAACIALFAGVLFVVTTVELVAGRPLSDVLHGNNGSGTTVFGSFTGHTTHQAPSPTTTVTVTPSVVVVTPTVTITTNPVTTTRTATPSTGPSASPTPSGSGSASPTASPSGSTTPVP